MPLAKHTKAEDGARATDESGSGGAAEVTSPDWQAIADALDVAISAYDADDRLIVFNKAYAEAQQTPGAGLEPGMHMLEVLEAFARQGRYGAGNPKKLAEKRYRDILDARRAGRPEEIRGRGGKTMIRERFPLAGGGVASVSHNIARRKQLERELSDTSAILSTTFKTLDQPACVWDGERRLVAWNDRFGEMTGVPVEEIKAGMHSRDFLLCCAENGLLGDGDPEALAAERFEAIWSGNLDLNDEIRRTDGRVYDVHRGPLPDGGMVSMFNDVTDRERAADDLRDARVAAETANATRTAFLANMSHELRTPLNAIIGFAELMMRAGDNSPEFYKGYSADIRTSANRLLDIINDLLDLSKIESGRIEVQPVPLNLNQAIQDCLDMIQQTDGAEGLAFVNDVPADFPSMITDESLIHQILLNLLSNALKATPDGGTVTVSAKQNDDATFELAVIDTGVGMPGDVMATIMDPYGGTGDSYVRAAKGTGLGLSIVQRQTVLLKGRFDIDSTPQAGTAIRLTLPMVLSVD